MKPGYSSLNGKPTTDTKVGASSIIVVTIFGVLILGLLIPTLVFVVQAYNKPFTLPPPPPCDIKIPVYPDSSVMVPSSVTGAPIVLVTGASRGIGRATAERFKSLGYFVIGTSREPTGPFTFPRYVPPSAPNVDVMLYLDLQNVSSFATFLAALDTVLAGPGGNRPLSAIVLNSGRFFFGSFAGILLKEYGITPYNNDPFPPGPGAWANYTKQSELISTNPSILLTQLITWPPLNVSLTTRINPVSLPRVIVIVSAIAFSRGQAFLSAYFKKALRDQIDSLRSEFVAVSPIFASLFITSLHPSVIDTNIYVITDIEGVGPIVGDVELIEPLAEIWRMFTGLAGSNSPSDVAEAVLQTVQMEDPPTDVLAFAESGLKHQFWTCIHKTAWCAGNQSGLLHDPVLIEEYRHDVLLAYNDFESDCLGGLMGINEPLDYQTLPSTSYTLSFNTIHLLPDATTLEISINGGTFVNIPTTFVPNVAVPTVVRYTASAPFDFSPYTGTTITLTARAVSTGFVDQVNALIVKTIHVTIP